MNELTVADAQRLWQWLERTERLEALSNAELADVVEEHLWAGLPGLSPASDVLSEVMDRLRKEPGMRQEPERHADTDVQQLEAWLDSLPDEVMPHDEINTIVARIHALKQQEGL
jgi:hypothetical protein